MKRVLPFFVIVWFASACAPAFTPPIAGSTDGGANVELTAPTATHTAASANPAPTGTYTPTPANISTPTTSPQVPTASPTTTATPVSLTSPFATHPPPQPPPGSVQIYDLSFIDSVNGWALGGSYDSNYGVTWAVVFRTPDGGRNWEIIPAPDALRWVPSINTLLPTVEQIRFVNQQNGWAIGSHRFVTRDGGLTWLDEGPIEDLLPMVAAGETAWTLKSKDCNESAYSMLTICTFTPWFFAEGQGWQPSSLAFTGYSPQLIRSSPATAWIYYLEEHNDQQAPRLLRTHDGGLHWDTLPTPPMGVAGISTNILQAVDKHHLWLVIGYYPGACTCGVKAVYVSTDGGETWELRASTEYYGDQKPVGEIALDSGYILNFTAVSRNRAFIGTGRGGILGTFDGGRTWRDVIPYELANPCDCNTGPVIFYDSQHGWAVTRAAIFRTTDGGETWKPISAPNVPGLSVLNLPLPTSIPPPYPPPLTPTPALSSTAYP